MPFQTPNFRHFVLQEFDSRPVFMPLSMWRRAHDMFRHFRASDNRATIVISRKRPLQPVPAVGLIIFSHFKPANKSVRVLTDASTDLLESLNAARELVRKAWRNGLSDPSRPHVMFLPQIDAYSAKLWVDGSTFTGPIGTTITNIAQIKTILTGHRMHDPVEDDVNQSRILETRLTKQSNDNTGMVPVILAVKADPTQRP